MIKTHFSFLFVHSSARTALLTAALLTVLSCSGKDRLDEAPLARVGDKYVTARDLDEAMRLNAFSMGEAAERWVDEQVLMKHATEANLIDQKSVTARLQRQERQLLIRLFLDSLLQNHITVDPEQIRAYYANNLQDFQFEDWAALVIHLGFHQLDEAQEAVDLLNATTSARDSTLNCYNYDRQLVYRNGLLPILSEVVFTGTTGKTYGPIASDFGYHIILIERFFNQGDTIPFIFVRKRIFERLFQVQLPLARSIVLDSLRETLDIEVYHE